MVSRYIAGVPTQQDLSDIIVARLRILMPHWTPDVTDPGVYFADDIAARLLALTRSVNTSADANSIITATGDALTELVRQFGITERREGETDAALRQRFQQQWEAITQGTPAWDIRRAFESSPLISDVSRSEVDWTNNLVTIHVLNDEYLNLEPAQQTNVQTELNKPDRPTFWLDYQVRPATIAYYTLTGTIYYTGTEEDPIVRAEESIENEMSDLARLDTGIDDSSFIAVAWGKGVTRIEITLQGMTKVGDDIYTLNSDTVPFAASVETVRHGKLNPALIFDATTKVSARSGDSGSWSRAYDPADIELPAINGHIQLQVPFGSYSSVECAIINVNGESSITEGETITMRQVNNTILESVGDYSVGAGVHIELTATRHYPNIVSSTEWE